MSVRVFLEAGIEQLEQCVAFCGLHGHCAFMIDGGPSCCRATGSCLLLFCQKPRDHRIGVAVPQLMLGFQMADELHVLERTGFLKDLHPVGNGFAVLLLNGWKVGSRTFDGFLSRHLNSFQSLARVRGAHSVTYSTSTTIKGIEFRQASASIFPGPARQHTIASAGHDGFQRSISSATTIT